MKKNINESYEWKIVPKINNMGKKVYRAVLDRELSTDNIFNVKDKLKSFGAQWDSVDKVWYFTLWKDPDKRAEQIEKVIKPCVQYLKSVETSPNGNDLESEMQKLLKQIDEVLNAPETSSTDENEDPADVKEVKSKLMDYKQELINSFKDNTFREKMGPIIKFRSAQGAGYSILNTILIMLQKPDAKMVKSISKWNAANKTIKPGAKPIYLWSPIGKRELTKDERLEVEVKFYKKMQKLYGTEIVSKNQLKVGDRERLEKELNRVVAVGFKLKPIFYDVSDTVQMPGKEDLIGNLEGFDDVEWSDETTAADERSQQLYNAIVETIKDFGISVDMVRDLGGAKGVSMGGKIEVLADAPKNIGAVSTLVHELSHELLHQTYLKTKGGEREDWAKYFVGKEFGKNIVEQQAEISAWIVMKNFGYDMQTAKNYVACWGGDEKTAAYAFDTVANVATRIIKGMSENLGMMNEGLGANTVITDMDVAELVGMADVYKKGKAEQQAGTDARIQSINEQFNSFLNRLNNVEF